jgi:hypothetical protein
MLRFLDTTRQRGGDMSVIDRHIVKHKLAVQRRGRHCLRVSGNVRLERSRQEGRKDYRNEVFDSGDCEQ